MSLVLKAANLKISDWSPFHTKARKTLYTRASQMTQMTAMTTPSCGIDPFDQHLYHGYDCHHTLNNNTNSETPHTISPTSLDMPRKASKNFSRGQFVIHGECAHPNSMAFKQQTNHNIHTYGTSHSQARLCRYVSC